MTKFFNLLVSLTVTVSSRSVCSSFNFATSTSFEHVKVLRWSVGIGPVLKNNLVKKKKKLIWFLFSSAELKLELWPQNAPCKNRARSNYRTRSLNRHEFLSINIDSTASRKNVGGFRIQGAFWGLYLHYWKVSRKKLNCYFFFDTS